MPDQKPFAGVSQEDSLTLLRQIFRLLKPLGNVVGGGSNRLQVEASLQAAQTLATVTTVTTVTGVTSVSSVAQVGNVGSVGGVNAFDQIKSQSRSAYSIGPRANLTF